ncbi:unnamed protein product [Ilex paraguariensis]|uniref:Alcohol dehydrogenase-like N-terminal domain-containing protein n=1 Tax=Ilex paraguariensis TaxID=185542 RepID=A0ABC8TQL6_9AQUA
MEVGCKVQKFKAGDKVVVGCFVGSCRKCESCTNNLENYCPEQKLTYGSTYFDGTITYGGYSDHMVTDEHFVFRWPDNLPLDSGMHIGVVGLGGLGHVAVKFAKAFAVKVTVISTSPNKKDKAIKKLGADSFFISSNPYEMQVIIIWKLAARGTLDGRKSVSRSSTGGLKETQEMLDFPTKHNITAHVEVISIDYVNIEMERLEKADVRYRFVLDVGKTLKAA